MTRFSPKIEANEALSPALARRNIKAAIDKQRRGEDPPRPAPAHPTLDETFADGAQYSASDDPEYGLSGLPSPGTNSANDAKQPPLYGSCQTERTLILTRTVAFPAHGEIRQPLNHARHQVSSFAQAAVLLVNGKLPGKPLPRGTSDAPRNRGIQSKSAFPHPGLASRFNLRGQRNRDRHNVP